MVRASDLKSGAPGFKSRSDYYHELFHGRPEFNFSAALVNSQIVRLLPVGIFNLVMFNLECLFLMFECSAPLKLVLNQLPRVNNKLINTRQYLGPTLSLICSQKTFCSTTLFKTNNGRDARLQHNQKL